MSAVYDSWERLIGAVLKREELRQIALCESLSSSVSVDFSSRFSFDSAFEDMIAGITAERYVYEEETHLTVLKTSIFFAGDGYTAYDCQGELVFRVDSYGPDAGDTGEVVLMDPSGRCVLTVRRKRPSLHQRWEGFVGEGAEGKKPLFSVRRSSIIGRSSMTVNVYTNPGEEYQIEGSFGCRNCTIMNAEKETVGEIRRKVDSSTNVLLGNDVFVLSLKPGFDAAFAMGLVLVLDQIHGTDDDCDSENGSRVDVDPAVDDSNLSP